MKLVMVLLTHIDNLPPARNLLLTLAQLDMPVDLITMYSDFLPKQIKKSKHFRIFDMQPEIEKNKMKCLVNRFIRRRRIRELIRAITEKNDVVWTVTDYDAMEVGNMLLGYRHVLQLMELIHDIPLFDEFPLLKVDISKIAKSAEIVIVPEYNRAHIQRAYWQLKETPRVIPNKPVVQKEDYDIDILGYGPAATEVLKKVEDKKIVLYQGVFGYERVLDQFIEAVNILGDDYCMVLMGRDDEELDKLLVKYPETFFIPFISAPHHLAITCKAYIGVLSYVNVNNIRHYDPLNAVYCAPNKLYEYACFGIPMVGNDIPGLEIPFKVNNIGKCSRLVAEDIAQVIKEIDKDYGTMSENCRNFYNSVNMNKLVEDIISELKKTI